MRDQQDYLIVFRKNSSKQFAGLVSPIVEEALVAARRVLPLGSPVRFEMIPSSSQEIATYMQGSAGWTHTNRRVDVWINTKVKGWGKALYRSVVHEFNHAVRAQRTRKRFGQYTLLDTIALEGLAQCFEKEVCGELPPYATAISIWKGRQIWNMVKPELNKIDDKLYRRLFFATADKDFPHWSGYTLSYLIVSRRMKQLAMTWPTIMNQSSEEIVGSGLG